MPSYSPLFNDATYGIPLDTSSRYAPIGVKEAVADVLVGAAAGATATKTRARVKAQASPTSIDTHAGKAVVESTNDINRATTATDVTNLKRDLGRGNRTSFAMPRDLSGNGGPAFTRSF